MSSSADARVAEMAAVFIDRLKPVFDRLNQVSPREAERWLADATKQLQIMGAALRAAHERIAELEADIATHRGHWRDSALLADQAHNRAQRLQRRVEARRAEDSELRDRVQELTSALEHERGIRKLGTDRTVAGLRARITMLEGLLRKKFYCAVCGVVTPP